jgi:hypothetical protein
MSSFYEVPVTLEFDEESMCVYVKVYANSMEEAMVKATDMVSANIEVYADIDDIVRI